MCILLDLICIGTLGGPSLSDSASRQYTVYLLFSLLKGRNKLVSFVVFTVIGFMLRSSFFMTNSPQHLEGEFQDTCTIPVVNWQDGFVQVGLETSA